ncbi:hypothetical protein B0I21_10636 [Sphingobacterium paludis]|uniref:Uncharacterized protein n=1 Tax=Sphingobacterium paludis TaxID=1476465 RepID=A0A4R7CWX4_9SPHI|nr:hypothetical protein B0I21_10636 [Sphingobacterium paludis]
MFFISLFSFIYNTYMYVYKLKNMQTFDIWKYFVVYIIFITIACF